MPVTKKKLTTQHLKYGDCFQRGQGTLGHFVASALQIKNKPKLLAFTKKINKTVGVMKQDGKTGRKDLRHLVQH